MSLRSLETIWLNQDLDRNDRSFWSSKKLFSQDLPGIQNVVSALSFNGKTNHRQQATKGNDFDHFFAFKNEGKLGEK